MTGSKTKSIFPRPIYLNAAFRSPIGKFGGTLKRLTAPELAAATLKGAMSRVSGLAPIDGVILGHARQAGAGPNPARQAVIFSGLPETVPAVTVNQACASGITAMIQAAEKIALGKAQSIWAGGVESMSNTPYFLMNTRWGERMGNSEITDGMHKDGFFCPMSQMLMGQTVETYLAGELGISRKEQDEYALRSQKRAAEAWKAGKFAAEILPIPADAKNPDKFPGLSEDEHMRSDTTLEKLAKLPAVFNAKSGTITAGNSSGITDGAAFVHVSSLQSANALAEFLDYETVALDPRRMGLGPVQAVKNLLSRHGLKVQDLEAVELNEAFAAQVLACQKELKIPEEKLNLKGGAIALGHPIGATGARITTTLLHLLKGKPGALGIATLCVSGGHGVAILVRSLI